ncbi:PEGA domain-containing protein [Candidatus Omnitrophota bacterium]
MTFKIVRVFLVFFILFSTFLVIDKSYCNSTEQEVLRAKVLEVAANKNINLDKGAVDYIVQKTVISGDVVSTSFTDESQLELIRGRFINTITDAIVILGGEGKINKQETEVIYSGLVIPDKIHLKIQSEPKGATIYCNNVKISKLTPIELILEPLELYRFRYVKDGYKEQIREYKPHNWEKNQVLTTVKLEKVL